MSRENMTHQPECKADPGLNLQISQTDQSSPPLAETTKGGAISLESSVLDVVRTQISTSRRGPGDDAEIQLKRDKIKSWIPVDSKPFKNFVARLAFAKFRLELTSRDINFAVAIISDEIAEQHPPGGPTLDDLTKFHRYPWARCLFTFIEQSPEKVTIRTSELVQKLISIADKLGFKKGDRGITKSPGLLGRQLSAFTSDLAKLGIIATSEHKTNGTYWTFSRTHNPDPDTSDGTLPTLSSAATADGQTTSSSTDDMTSKAKLASEIQEVLGDLAVLSKEMEHADGQ